MRDLNAQIEKGYSVLKVLGWTVKSHGDSG